MQHEELPYFPDDIKEDMHFGPLRLTQVIQMVLVLAGGLFLFALIPVPLTAKFVLFFLPSLLFSMGIAFDVPIYWRRQKKYRKEPLVRTSEETKKNLDIFFPVRSKDYPFLELADGEWVVGLKVTGTNWDNEPLRNRFAQSFGFRKFIRKIRRNHASILITEERFANINVTEWNRQVEKVQKFNGNSLYRLGLNRVKLQRDRALNNVSQQTYYVVRIGLSPEHVKEEKGKSKEETIKQRLKKLVYEGLTYFSQADMQAFVLSEDEYESAVFRQFLPGAWKKELLSQLVPDLMSDEDEFIFSVSDPGYSSVEEDRKFKMKQLVRRIMDWFLDWREAVEEKLQLQRFTMKMKEMKKEELQRRKEQQEEWLRQMKGSVPKEDVQLEEANPMVGEKDIDQDGSVKREVILGASPELSSSDRLAKNELEGKIITFTARPPTGKTFLATNSAAYLAQHQFVKLVDLDFHSRAIHTWMNVTPGSQHILQLFETDEGEGGYAPVFLQNLSIYTLDPELNRVPDQWRVSNFYGHLTRFKEEGKVVVIDLPFIHPMARTVMGLSDQVFYVIDGDYHHMIQCRRDWHKFEEWGITSEIIWNQMTDVGYELFEEMGQKPVAEIPVLPNVFQSIYEGRPLVLTDRQLQHIFDEIINK